ncbi:MAG TPA: hypothetical protein VNJ04_09495 [Gemmatimonadaceae bacterium]|nr:hypothetical protein [Gemmatimonadaceae bacterium]
MKGFREHVLTRQDALIADVAFAIGSRIQRAQRKGLETLDLKQEVRRGFERLRVIEPKVRIVLKDVAWESSRDKEFMTALAQAFPKTDLEGWFEEFNVARERVPE